MSRVEELINEHKKLRSHTLNYPSEQALIALARELEAENHQLRAALREIRDVAQDAWIFEFDKPHQSPCDMANRCEICLAEAALSPAEGQEERELP